MARISKQEQPIHCKSADHCFIHVETTPHAPQSYGQLGGFQQVPSAVRTFKLFCSKCGEVRAL